MKSLYRERYFSQTKEADEISKEFEDAITPILKKYFEAGYSPREIAHIAHDVIHIQEAWIVLEHGSKEAKKDRLKREKIKKEEKNG